MLLARRRESRSRSVSCGSHKKGFRYVRLIHGKGIGVQREIVRKVLAETSFVKGFKSGDEFSGGWGATIADFQVR